jgi:transcriptional regulator with XRE-family HTH domain
MAERRHVTDEEAVAKEWRALGRQLAASRQAAGMSQAQLAPLSGYSRSAVANAETGRQHIPRKFWKACDEALETGTALARGYDQVKAAERGGHLRAAAITQQARTAVAGHLSSGDTSLRTGRASEVPVGSSGPGQVESIRRWLDDALTGGAVSREGIEDWEDAVRHHGRATRTRPAGEQIIELAADMTELGQAIRRCRSASSLRGLVRVTAKMAGLMCLLYVKLDERDAFQRWARTARTAAMEAGDPAVLSWVLAQEAYGHFYGGDLTTALTVAQHAQAQTPGAVGVGTALAAALEARVQGTRGRVRETGAAMGRAEAVLDLLPPVAVTASAFGYTESQLRFHEENAYTHLGDWRRAAHAQERALELCPPGDYTDWAMIRLDRARCLLASGYAAVAVEYAAETLTPLRAVHSQGIIALQARDLVRALPAGHRAAPEVRELERLLTAPRVKELPG